MKKLGDIWMTKAEAAEHIGLSVATIERRSVPWQKEPVRLKIRFKYLCLDDTITRPRFFRADVEALSKIPKYQKRAKQRLKAAYDARFPQPRKDIIW